MMTVLSVVRDVCSAVGVTLPTSVFTNLSANRTMTEMVALANEMAQRIAYDTREWRRLQATITYAGNGAATAFNLPNDFQRMLKNSDVWRSSSSVLPMRFIADSNEWMRRRLASNYDARGEWALIGNQIQIYPAMGDGVSAAFVYLNKNCVALNSGGYGTSFLTDADSFVLDERLLRLGMIWQWKAHKGSSYVEDMSTYTDALAMAQGADKPMPVIVGRQEISANVYASYPFAAPAS